jgi:integrase/recombinase XerD
MLPLEVEEFLSWMVAEKGRSSNTLAAYRRDLAGYCEWLAAHGTGVGGGGENATVAFV